MSLIRTISAASIPLVLSLIVLLVTAPILLTQFPPEHFLNLSILFGMAGLFSIIDFGLGKSYITSLSSTCMKKQLPFIYGTFVQLNSYLFITLIFLYFIYLGTGFNDAPPFLIDNLLLLILLLFISAYLSLSRSILDSNSLFKESNIIRAVIQITLAVSPLLALGVEQPIQLTLHYILIGRLVVLFVVSLLFMVHVQNKHPKFNTLKFIDVKLTISHFSIIIFISLFGLLDRYFAFILLDSEASNLYAKIFEGISRTTLLAAVFSSYFLTKFSSENYLSKNKDFFIFFLSISFLYLIIVSIFCLAILFFELNFGEAYFPSFVMLLAAYLISLSHFPNSYLLSKETRYFLVYIYILEILVILIAYYYMIDNITLFTFSLLFLLRASLDFFLQYFIYTLALFHEKRILLES